MAEPALFRAGQEQKATCGGGGTCTHVTPTVYRISTGAEPVVWGRNAGAGKVSAGPKVTEQVRPGPARWPRVGLTGRCS